MINAFHSARSRVEIEGEGRDGTILATQIQSIEAVIL